MQIDTSFFKDQNYLHIPLSVNDPSGSVTPSTTELDYLCEKLGVIFYLMRLV
jgi:hypothetical protein